MATNVYPEEDTFIAQINVVPFVDIVLVLLIIFMLTSSVIVKYTERKREKRQADRERIHRQVVHPIDTPRQIRDPLKRTTSRIISTFTVARLLASAAMIHILLLLFFIIANQVIGDRSTYRPAERVQVRILDIPPSPLKPSPTDEPATIKKSIQPKVTAKKKKPIPSKKKTFRFNNAQRIYQKRGDGVGHFTQCGSFRCQPAFDHAFGRGSGKCGLNWS